MSFTYNNISQINNYSTSTAPNSTQPFLAGLECAQQETDERIYDLVGEIIVNIGRNIQLLECEQEQLKVNNTRINGHINDLKTVHLAELEAVIQDYQAKVYAVSLKLKAIVDRFKWMKETFIGVNVKDPAFKNALRGLSENGNSVVQGYYKAFGMVSVRRQMDACLEDEGCESVCADWLKLITEEMSAETKKKMIDLWGLSEGKDCVVISVGSVISTNVPLPNSTSLESISSHFLCKLPFENQPIVQKLTKGPTVKLQAVKIATEEMRVTHHALIEKKELLLKAQSDRLANVKFMLAARFMEELDKANGLYNSLEKLKESENQFSDCVDPRRTDGRLLTDPYLSYAQNGYMQELKLIQDLLTPIISTLSTYIAEYGKVVVESRKSLFPDDKTTIEELIHRVRMRLDKEYAERKNEEKLVKGK